MKRKILTLFIFVLIVSVSSGFGFAKKNKINVYDSIIKRDKMLVGISFDSKPFGFQNSDGRVEGLEADLAREIAKRILGSEEKIEFRDVASQERLNAAAAGDVDMVISTITITPQRKKMVTFSEPYFVAGQVICVRKDSKITALGDLLNKRVIVELGTTGEENIKKFAPNALIQSYVNNSDAINAFKSGSADAITTDDALLQGLVIDNGDYRILPNKLTKEPYGIAFKKSRQSKSLKNNVNKIIDEIKRDGTLSTIKSKWEIN